MDLTHRDKEIIKSVIEGFTYHQKYRLYVELAKDLAMNTKDLVRDMKEEAKLTEGIVKDLQEDSKLKGDLKSGINKIDTALKPKSSRSKK